MTIGCTVAELGRRMGASEFGNWLEFFDQEPFGPAIQNRQWGEMLAALHNGPLSKGKSKTLWKRADFVADPWSPPKPPRKAATASDAKAFVKSLKTKAKG